MKPATLTDRPATPADRTCQEPAISSDSTCPNDCQVAQGIEKREPVKKEKENAQQQLSDDEWLRTIVQPKFASWTFDQLKLQWLQHRKKGKEQGKWIPGDRGHFLIAWMPRAGDSPSLPKATTEPPWWRDFLDERYPQADQRDFARVQKLPSGLTVVREGYEWAASQDFAGPS